ncbi:MAG: hypothetical protein ACD_75C01578G0001, partial [uncultured bacterium]
ARLDETGRLAIATAILEGRVTNERLQELTDKHPRDITFLLKRLVEERFLVGNDKRRWSSYTLAPITPGPSSQHNEPSSQHKDVSSQHNESSSQHKGLSSQHKDADSRQPEEDTDNLSAEYLPALIQEIRTRKRSAPAKVEAAILALCRDRFTTVQDLAEMLERETDTLKNHYLSKMIRDGRLELRFPERPTHPLQAYKSKIAQIGVKNDDTDSGTGP